MEVEKIYFDMDGVLANFEKGVQDLCHMDPPPQGGKRNQAEDDEMWERIKKTEHFYFKLELMPGAKDMFDAVYEKYGNKCEILTGVPKEKRGIVTAEADKKEWVKKFLSDEVIVHTVKREEKRNYCDNEEYILIDDLQKNIDEWTAKRGTGVLNESAKTTMEKLREMGIL